MARKGAPHTAQLELLEISLKAKKVDFSKVLAMIDGRYHVSTSDVARVAQPVLRHRIVRTFEAETDGHSTDAIIDRILESVPLDPDRSDAVRLVPGVLRGEGGAA